MWQLILGISMSFCKNSSTAPDSTTSHETKRDFCIESFSIGQIVFTDRKVLEGIFFFHWFTTDIAQAGESKMTKFQSLHSMKKICLNKIHKVTLVVIISSKTLLKLLSYYQRIVGKKLEFFSVPEAYTLDNLVVYSSFPTC